MKIIVLFLITILLLAAYGESETEKKPVLNIENSTLDETKVTLGDIELLIDEESEGKNQYLYIYVENKGEAAKTELVVLSLKGKESSSMGRFHLTILENQSLVVPISWVSNIGSIDIKVILKVFENGEYKPVEYKFFHTVYYEKAKEKSELPAPFCEFIVILFVVLLWRRKIDKI